MIRANAVEVFKMHQARCLILGCGWTGEPHATYQDANFDRQAHLEEHRRTEAAQ